eukprot:RCo029847
MGHLGPAKLLGLKQVHSLQHRGGLNIDPAVEFFHNCGTAHDLKPKQSAERLGAALLRGNHFHPLQLNLSPLLGLPLCDKALVLLEKLLLARHNLVVPLQQGLRQQLLVGAQAISGNAVQVRQGCPLLVLLGVERGQSGEVVDAKDVELLEDTALREFEDRGVVSSCCLHPLHSQSFRCGCREDQRVLFQLLVAGQGFMNDRMELPQGAPLAALLRHHSFPLAQGQAFQHAKLMPHFRPLDMLRHKRVPLGHFLPFQSFGLHSCGCDAQCYPQQLLVAGQGLPDELVHLNEAGALAALLGLNGQGPTQGEDSKATQLAPSLKLRGVLAGHRLPRNSLHPLRCTDLRGGCGGAKGEPQLHALCGLGGLQGLPLGQLLQLQPHRGTQGGPREPFLHQNLSLGAVFSQLHAVSGLLGFDA